MISVSKQIFNEVIRRRVGGAATSGTMSMLSLSPKSTTSKVFNVPRSKMATQAAAAASSSNQASFSFAPFFPQSAQGFGYQQAALFEPDFEYGYGTSTVSTSQVSQPQFYLPLRFRAGEKAQRYKLGKVVGEGYFATVYEATDLSAKHEAMKKVAVKAINKSKCPKELFSEELKVMRYIQSFTSKNPSRGDDALNFARDVFETQDKVYFVLDLCQGGDMFDYLAAHKQLPESDAKVVVRRLLEGLQILHKNGVVHRDVKIENIIIQQKDNLASTKLTDFGYAKILSDADVFKNPAGTFGYVAPEVLKSRSYSDKCDTWSTGVVLYTLVAGYQPFPYAAEVATKAKSSARSMNDVELEAILHGREEKVWAQDMNTDAFVNISNDLKDLLAGLLCVDPSKRLSAEEALSHPWFENATKHISTIAHRADASLLAALLPENGPTICKAASS